MKSFLIKALCLIGCYFILTNEETLMWYDKNKVVYLWWFLPSSAILLITAIIYYGISV